MSNKYDIDWLDDRGDDYEIQGITFTVKAVCDEDMSILDEQGEGVWCGRLEWPSLRTNNYGHHVRPADFDGNAELLGFNRSYDRIWWQPPEDVARTDPHFAELRRSVLDALEYGYVGVIVECEHGERSLWGIDSMESEYQADVACELIDELLRERELEVADWWPSYERSYTS